MFPLFRSPLYKPKKLSSDRFCIAIQLKRTERESGNILRTLQAVDKSINFFLLLLAPHLNLLKWLFDGQALFLNNLLHGLTLIFQKILHFSQNFRPKTIFVNIQVAVGRVTIIWQKPRRLFQIDQINKPATK